ncbi:MAG: sigma-70 family RNA polymerase sigma factor [Oscillospiraceae bacterium]|nr:sigma-70 family RNA polymerase sigma factor [Oscillospiraceae bacterium]
MSGPSPALLEAAKRGDRQAQERLLTENSRLVWSIVSRYQGRGAEPEDLFQLGCIGFLKAVQGFDSSYGTQFSTYAVPKIAGEMLRFHRDDGAVKVSRTLREQAVRIARARAELTQRGGGEPSLSELAQALGMEPEEIALAESSAGPVVSLSAETGEDLTLESLLGDEGMEESLVERLDLRHAIAALPERERQVICLRYYRALTQDQTARIVGVSQVQISRIERRAVGRLRQALEG